MNVEIQSVRFDADQNLIDFVQHKMNKLDRFFERIIDAEVVLKLDKDNEKGNKNATVMLDVPGGILVAERQCKTFEESVDLCVEALKKQLERTKEKI